MTKKDLSKEELLKLLGERITENSLQRLLDGDISNLEKFLNFSHLEQETYSNLPSSIRDQFLKTVSLLNNNNENFDLFEYSLEDKGKKLFQELSKEKITKLSTSAEKEFVLNNKKN